MKFPGPLWSAFRRLFPPATGTDHIHAPVAINISDTHSMRVHAGLFGNLMHDPRRGGIGGVRLCIFQISITSPQEFGASIALLVFLPLSSGGSLCGPTALPPLAPLAPPLSPQIYR